MILCLSPVFQGCHNNCEAGIVSSVCCFLEFMNGHRCQLSEKISLS